MRFKAFKSFWRLMYSTDISDILTHLEYAERTNEILGDLHGGPGVVKLPAVVGGGEDGDERPLLEELVPVLDDLVRPDDEAAVLLLQELRHHVSSEGEAHSPVVLAPSVYRL